jgi:hypothetical protein
MMVFAAGDVTLDRANRVLIISGGKVRTKGRCTNAFICAANKTEAAIPFPKTARVLDGKPTPAPDLFTFRDLWGDYGLEAALDQGRVKITKAKADGPFSHLLKQDDIILALVHSVAPHPQPLSPEGRGEKKKLKIDSVGQFRRLLGHSLDLGSFDFDIERAGKTIALHEKLKKRQP